MGDSAAADSHNMMSEGFYPSALIRKLEKNTPKSTRAKFADVAPPHRSGPCQIVVDDPILSDLMKFNPHKSTLISHSQQSHPPESINYYSTQMSELLYLLNEEKELDDNSRMSIESSLFELTSYIPTSNYDFDSNDQASNIQTKNQYSQSNNQATNYQPLYYPNEHLSKILLDNYPQLHRFSSSYFNLTLSSHVTKYMVELIYALQYWEVYHLLYAIPDLEYLLKLVGIEVSPTPFGPIVRPPENYMEMSMRQGFQYPFPYPFYNYSYHSLNPDVVKNKLSRVSIKPYNDITLKKTPTGNEPPPVSKPGRKKRKAESAGGPATKKSQGRPKASTSSAASAPAPPVVAPTPVLPQAPTPVLPQAPTPVEPQAPSPVEPQAPSPVERQAPSPVEPQAPNPVEPQASAPVEPQVPFLVEPQASALVEPQASALVAPPTSSLVAPPTSALDAPPTSTLDAPPTSTLDAPQAPAPVDPQAPAPVDPQSPAPVEPQAPVFVEPQASAPIEPQAFAPIEHRAPTLVEPEAPIIAESSVPQAESNQKLTPSIASTVESQGKEDNSRQQSPSIQIKQEQVTTQKEQQQTPNPETGTTESSTMAISPAPPQVQYPKPSQPMRFAPAKPLNARDPVATLKPLKAAPAYDAPEAETRAFAPIVTRLSPQIDANMNPSQSVATASPGQYSISPRFSPLPTSQSPPQRYAGNSPSNAKPGIISFQFEDPSTQQIPYYPPKRIRKASSREPEQSEGRKWSASRSPIEAKPSKPSNHNTPPLPSLVTPQAPQAIGSNKYEDVSSALREAGKTPIMQVDLGPKDEPSPGNNAMNINFKNVTFKAASNAGSPTPQYSGMSSNSSSSSDDDDDADDEDGGDDKTAAEAATGSMSVEGSTIYSRPQVQFNGSQLTIIPSEHERNLGDDGNKGVIGGFNAGNMHPNINVNLTSTPSNNISNEMAPMLSNGQKRTGIIHQCHLRDPTSGDPCLKIFYGKNELLRHQEFVHATKKKIYKCIYCSRSGSKVQSYPRHDSLARHIRRKHGVTGKENKLAVNYAKENVEIIDEGEGMNEDDANNNSQNNDEGIEDEGNAGPETGDGNGIEEIGGQVGGPMAEVQVSDAAGSATGEMGVNDDVGSSTEVKGEGSGGDGSDVYTSSGGVKGGGTGPGSRKRLHSAPLPHPEYLNSDFTIKSSYSGFLSFSTREHQARGPYKKREQPFAKTKPSPQAPSKKGKRGRPPKLGYGNQPPEAPAPAASPLSATTSPQFEQDDHQPPPSQYEQADYRSLPSQYEQADHRGARSHYEQFEHGVAPSQYEQFEHLGAPPQYEQFEHRGAQLSQYEPEHRPPPSQYELPENRGVPLLQFEQSEKRAMPSAPMFWEAPGPATTTPAGGAPAAASISGGTSVKEETDTRTGSASGAQSASPFDAPYTANQDNVG